MQPKGEDSRLDRAVPRHREKRVVQKIWSRRLGGARALNHQEKDGYVSMMKTQGETRPSQRVSVK